MTANASEARILVVGLVRNAADKVEADVRRLESALMGFASVHWLLVESDSSDATPAVLRGLVDRIPNFRYASLGSLRERLPQRTARIAYCRNHYLRSLESEPIYNDIDTVIVSDFDGTNDRLEAAGLRSCWRRSDWAVCAANQAGPYYDIWALRHPIWSPNDCETQHAFLIEHGVGPEDALRASVLSRMIVIPHYKPWIEVDSAFGGLAVYRRRFVAGLRYEGLTLDGKEICEHVSFHAAIRSRGGSIYINPELINTAAIDHTNVLRLSQRLRRIARRAAKRFLIAIAPGHAAHLRARTQQS